MKKNIYKIFASIFVCLAILPIFVACSGTGGTELRGVRFTQSVYEADRTVPVKLEYKVYPSTAQNYNLDFEFYSESSSAWDTQFTFDKNTRLFTIKENADNDFELKVTVTSGSYSDECKVKLKQYPTEIKFAEDTVYINKNGTLNLQLLGKSAGSSEFTTVLSENYNIELTSSNNSIVSTDNTMMVASNGKSGSVTITAKIKDLSGNYIIKDRDDAIKEAITATIEVIVIDNVSECDVFVKGLNNYIALSGSDTQSESNTITINETQLALAAWLYSSDGVKLDNDVVDITFVSQNPKIVSVKKDGDGNYILDSNGRYLFDINLTEGRGTSTNPGSITKIDIYSSATDSKGNPVKFSLYIKIDGI